MQASFYIKSQIYTCLVTKPITLNNNLQIFPVVIHQLVSVYVLVIVILDVEPDRKSGYLKQENKINITAILMHILHTIARNHINILQEDMSTILTGSNRHIIIFNDIVIGQLTRTLIAIQLNSKGMAPQYFVIISQICYCF